jgi:hypothetical protein
LQVSDRSTNRFPVSNASYRKSVNQSHELTVDAPLARVRIRIPDGLQVYQVPWAQRMRFGNVRWA